MTGAPTNQIIRHLCWPLIRIGLILVYCITTLCELKCFQKSSVEGKFFFLVIRKGVASLLRQVLNWSSSILYRIIGATSSNHFFLINSIHVFHPPNKSQAPYQLYCSDISGVLRRRRWRRQRQQSTDVAKWLSDLQSKGKLHNMLSDFVHVLSHSNSMFSLPPHRCFRM